ncbi:hypothetical protein FACS189427_13810 [Planctomycetales bacterium]|nr:hypothetical protein FACS189427_13810 [Planctomycetales bacterium]
MLKTLNGLSQLGGEENPTVVNNNVAVENKLQTVINFDEMPELSDDWDIALVAGPSGNIEHTRGLCGTERMMNRTS